MNKYAKAILAVLGAVLTAVLASFPDNAAVQQWGPIVSAALTAVGVYLVPNAKDPVTEDADDFEYDDVDSDAGHS